MMSGGRCTGVNSTCGASSTTLTTATSTARMAKRRSAGFMRRQGPDQETGKMRTHWQARRRASHLRVPSLHFCGDDLARLPVRSHEVERLFHILRDAHRVLAQHGLPTNVDPVGPAINNVRASAAVIDPPDSHGIPPVEKRPGGPICSCANISVTATLRRLDGNDDGISLPRPADASASIAELAAEFS